MTPKSLFPIKTNCFSESSTFRFFIGKSPDCGTVSASGVFFVVDADSACSSRNDLPRFVYSSTLDTALDGKYSLL